MYSFRSIQIGHRCEQILWPENDSEKSLCGHPKGCILKVFIISLMFCEVYFQREWYSFWLEICQFFFLPPPRATFTKYFSKTWRIFSSAGGVNAVIGIFFSKRNWRKELGSHAVKEEPVSNEGTECAYQRIGILYIDRKHLCTSWQNLWDLVSLSVHRGNGWIWAQNRSTVSRNCPGRERNNSQAGMLRLRKVSSACPSSTRLWHVEHYLQRSQWWFLSCLKIKSPSSL